MHSAAGLLPGRENGRYLPPRVFQARRDQFVKGDTGLLNQKVEMVNPMANMMTDPTMMVCPPPPPAKVPQIHILHLVDPTWPW